MKSIAFAPEPARASGSDVARALLFLWIAVGVRWLQYGPVGARYRGGADRVLERALGSAAGYYLLTAVAICALLLALTRVFLRRSGCRSLFDIGWRRAGLGDFWAGLIAGFIPGLLLALGLVLGGFGDVQVTGSPATVLWYTCETLITVLVACGYAFQVLWRRAGGFAAVLAVAGISAITMAITADAEGRSTLRLLTPALLCFLLGLAFRKGRGIWLPTGLAVGLNLAPTGGSLMLVSWASPAESPWRPDLWSLYTGIPNLSIMAFAAVLVGTLRLDAGPGPEPRKRLSGLYAPAWTLCLGYTCVLLAYLFRLANEASAPEPEPVVLVSTAVCWLACPVIFSVWLYKIWASIQDTQTRTRAGAAVGLMFIPVFNFYWVFRAVAGFAAEYNRYVERRGLEIPRLSRAPFITHAIVCLVALIPLYGIVGMIPAVFSGAVAMRRACMAVNALREAEPDWEWVRGAAGSSS